jgi:hypothetical protein
MLYFKMFISTSGKKRTVHGCGDGSDGALHELKILAI